MVLLDPQQLLGFLAAAVLITACPGPDNLMVLSVGISQGRRQGMAFGVGCALGSLTHTALAALGVSALIAASRPAFTGLRWFGGAYLLWLGWQSLRSRPGALPPGAAAAPAAERVGRPFLRGLVAASVNPKLVLFFLAFLPQFVDAARGSPGSQILQLGVLFSAQSAALFAGLGFFAGAIGSWLSRTPGAGIWLDRLAGAVLAGLGLRLIVTRQ